MDNVKLCHIMEVKWYRLLFYVDFKEARPISQPISFQFKGISASF